MVSRLIDRIIKANVTLSRSLEFKNFSEYGAHVEYLRVCALLFSAPDVRQVLDVAAGSRWHFPSSYKSGYALRLTGLDVDANDLRQNASLDATIIGDVCDGSPLGEGGYDLITCYSGIEHFHDVEKFLSNAFASLRPGGALVAQFPSSWAPFAILNRVVPERAKARLIETLFPSQIREIGYPAHYDKCRYSAFRAAAERSGFEVEYYLPSFFSSGYFSWFVPAFLASQLLDTLRLLFGSRDMASYNLFVLRRPGDHFELKWSWHSV